jgi:ribulose-phosphate 3-epimerase
MKPEVHLEVDGGLDGDTARGVVEAGADILVAGNFIFGSPDIAAAITSLRARTASGR